MSRNSKALSPETIAKILKHLEAGDLSRADICERYGIRPSTLGKNIKKFKETLKQKENYNEST